MLEDKDGPGPEPRPLGLTGHVPVQPLPGAVRHVSVAEDLEDAEDEPSHPDVHPVAGVTAGVAQLLHSRAAITIQSEQEISDILDH